MNPDQNLRDERRRVPAVRTAQTSSLTDGKPNLEGVGTLVTAPSNGSTSFPLVCAAIAGILASAILFVNAGKRAGLIPVSPLTQLLAPLAQALAIVLIVGIAQVALRMTRRFTAIAVGVNLVGLAAATGTEWVINLVFAQLDASTITALRSGPLGIAFLVASVVFLAGSLLFCTALFRDGAAPKIPTVAYAVASIPIGLRNLVPEIVLDSALAVLAASVLWLALWLLNSVNAPKSVTSNQRG